jgi:polyisoprenoid-binding protein YceI
MKVKQIIVAILVLAICTEVRAQKIYSTKTGSISFFSSTPLEDIEAKTSEVESKLSANGQVAFMLLMKGFRFENQEMEDHFNEEYVESTKYPKAEFRGVITNMNEINLSKNGVYPAKVKGNLTIHGVTKEVATTGTIEVKGARVIARSKFTIILKDYNIGGTLIGKKIANSIAINVSCEYD